jgi:hypothetical protein
VTVTSNYIGTELIPSFKLNAIVTVPIVAPKGGLKSNEGPEGKKIAQDGMLTMIIETGYDSGSEIEGRLYVTVAPSCTLCADNVPMVGG